MATLEKRPGTLSPLQPQARPDGAVEAGIRRLGPSLSRLVAETAGAFFSSQAGVEAAWDAPRLDGDALHCSQRNVGEKFELLCNLSADREEYARLFPAGVPESIRLDAYCELANCVCGAILADGQFEGEFGYLIPCVPCSGIGRVPAGARALYGAFRLKGAWIRFTLAIRDTAA